LAQNTSNKRRAVTIHPPARLVVEPKKTKKERKEGRKEERKKYTRNSGKLAIRPDHPCRRIKIKLCMVGGLWCVETFKCDPYRLRGYGAVGVDNGSFLLMWPSAYTTACRPTTVQAVIKYDVRCTSSIHSNILAIVLLMFGTFLPLTVDFTLFTFKRSITKVGFSSCLIYVYD